METLASNTIVGGCVDVADVDVGDDVVADVVAEVVADVVVTAFVVVVVGLLK